MNWWPCVLVISSVLVAPASAAVAAQPEPQPATASAPSAGVLDRVTRWREDLAFLAKELPARHKNAFFKTPKEAFERAVAELDGKLPDLSDERIGVVLMRLVAMLGDAHTTVDPMTVRPRHGRYPLGLYWFSDGLVVFAAGEEDRGLLGGRLVKVGATPVDEAIRTVGSVFPHENEAALKLMAPRWVMDSTVLGALDLSPALDSAEFTFAMPDGSDRVVKLSTGEAKPGKSYTLRDVSGHGAKPPLREQRPLEPYWCTMLPEHRALYIKYNRCVPDAGKDPVGNPVNGFPQFAEKVLAMIDAGAAEGDGQIERVIVDLRDNGGGNSAIAKPLIDGLAARERINRPGGLFVVIGRATFSSAQLNAAEFRQRTRAVLVGEPTAQKPNAYGEVKSFELPNSRVRINYSTKYFRTDPEDPESMMPDVRVEMSSADYAAGKDPVLEAIFTYTPPAQ